MDYSKLEKIENFIFDVDGVFTDGTLLITEEGNFLRKMHVRDGMALKVAVEQGYKVAIITKGNSSGVRDRLKALGADPVYIGIDDKKIPFVDLVEKHGFDPEKSLYMGDDIADLPILDKVLLSTCPKDSCTEVLERAEYISPRNGGDGCVRDIVEKVLRIRGDWRF